MNGRTPLRPRSGADVLECADAQPLADLALHDTAEDQAPADRLGLLRALAPAPPGFRYAGPSSSKPNGVRLSAGLRPEPKCRA